MGLVLVIEDDESTAQEIVAELTSHGFAVDLAADGEEGLRKASTGEYAVITLDRMLPRMDGLALVRALRDRAVQTPVLMISALSDVDERIAGLRAGGDDYMTKPFNLEELVARLRGLLRRSAYLTPADEETFTIGDLHLDSASRTVTRAGASISLSSTEFELLRYLMRHARRAVTRQEILDRVWNYDFGGKSSIVDLYVSYLRKKVDAGHPAMIHTVRGVGYVLRAGT